MTSSAEQLAADVKALARDCGYAACGITSAAPFERDREAIEARVRLFPEAAGLYQGFRRRFDPRETAPWCNSVIACIRRYGKYRLPPQPVGHIGRHYLADSRLEVCPDHSLAARMTAGLRAMGIRCKRGGVPDRWAAVRSGAARFGRNCFAYADGCGSWINIQTWRIDAALPPDPATPELPCPDGCTACMDACPTGAIEEALCMRMDRCIAYLTYHAPFPIKQELWDKMGPWIYGCDVCQQVCPLNRGMWEDREEAPWLAAIADLLTPEALATMDAETYRAIVHPLFWYIPEDDLARWHANARRAAQHCS
jgi:epoxyqueuosine reductase